MLTTSTYIYDIYFSDENGWIVVVVVGVVLLGFFFGGSGSNPESILEKLLRLLRENEEMRKKEIEKDIQNSNSELAKPITADSSKGHFTFGELVFVNFCLSLLVISVFYGGFSVLTFLINAIYIQLTTSVLLKYGSIYYKYLSLPRFWLFTKVNTFLVNYFLGYRAVDCVLYPLVLFWIITF
jgi:hypothetical protein